MSKQKSGSMVPGKMTLAEAKQWRPDPANKPTRVIPERLQTKGRMNAVARYEQVFARRKGVGGTKDQIMAGMKNIRRKNETVYACRQAYTALLDCGYIREIELTDKKDMVFVIFLVAPAVPEKKTATKTTGVKKVEGTIKVDRSKITDLQPVETRGSDRTEEELLTQRMAELDAEEGALEANLLNVRDEKKATQTRLTELLAAAVDQKARDLIPNVTHLGELAFSELAFAIEAEKLRRRGRDSTDSTDENDGAGATAPAMMATPGLSGTSSATQMATA